MQQWGDGVDYEPHDDGHLFADHVNHDEAGYNIAGLLSLGQAASAASPARGPPSVANPADAFYNHRMEAMPSSYSALQNLFSSLPHTMRA